LEELLLSVIECTCCYAVRQTELHTAEPVIPEPSSFKAEVAIEKLKRYKAQGIDQILEELIQAGSNKSHSEIHKLINSI
jgi:hypothetical protein